MKKEINSKSRRKWVVTGIAAFASIALLTTGFAVWVIGNATTEKSNNVGVSVNTAENKSLDFTFSLTDSTITLAEGTVVNTGFVQEQTAVTDPLKVTYTGSITFGAEFDTTTYTKIQFEIVASDDATTTASVVATNNTTGKHQDNQSYIAAPADLSIDLTSATDNNDGTKSLALTGDLLFSWGNYFNNQSPCTYYNTEFTGDDCTAANAAKIKKELDAMHDQLDGKTIGLKATLSA